jgi:hypothetical protein
MRGERGVLDGVFLCSKNVTRFEIYFLDGTGPSKILPASEEDISSPAGGFCCG